MIPSNRASQEKSLKKWSMKGSKEKTRAESKMAPVAPILLLPEKMRRRSKINPLKLASTRADIRIIPKGIIKRNGIFAWGVSLRNS